LYKTIKYQPHQKRIVHKLNISFEASWDITHCLELKIDKCKLKLEVEEYIARMAAGGYLPYRGYFRCDYICEDSGERLKLFVFEGPRFSSMQIWDLAGVCLAADWSEEFEENGQIQRWLKMRVVNLPFEEDWSIAVRVRQVLKNTSKTLIENVLKEVTDEFKYKRDQETAKKMALLQSVFFKFRKRTEKENRPDRTTHRRT